MNKEDIFDKEQLEILLKDLQDIDKFTGFKDGAFKYELGKYQANLLVNCIKKYKEVIDKAIEYTEEHRINNPYHYEYNCFMENARASDLLDILKEVE